MENGNGKPKSAAELRAEIELLEAELRGLRGDLLKAEEHERETQDETVRDSDGEGKKAWKWPLLPEEYERYSRQLVLPSVGIQGQLRLKAASVLIVGAGGLGCPAAAYLAGAGVGTIGVADGDVVEASNLHRQIAHATARVGTPKADSLLAFLRALNPLPAYAAHRAHLSPDNAADVVGRYDVVLDCTDHPAARYLVSDACVLLGKPLVSASALRTDGQLVVLNCPPAPRGDERGGPCYRCVFPRPPPPESVVGCGEGGILGPVVGVMGVLQALEAIRIIAAGRHLPISAPGERSTATTVSRGEEAAVAAVAAVAAAAAAAEKPTLLLFSAAGPGGPTFRTVRMRGRRKDCFACSASSTLALRDLTSGSLDYVQFCGGPAGGAPVSVLRPEERVSAREYYEDRSKEKKKKRMLLDVREKEHFDVASIEGAVNVPFSRIQGEGRQSEYKGGGGDGEKQAPLPSWLPSDLERDTPIYLVCRVGNDSQLVTRQLKDMGLDRNGERFIGDIRGGMRAWKAEVDDTIPFT